MNANAISPEIWVNLHGKVSAPTEFDVESLANAGWKQVVTESEVIANQHHKDGVTLKYERAHCELLHCLSYFGRP